MFALGQEPLEIGSYDLVCGRNMKIKRTHIFFLSGGLVVAELKPFFDVFSTIFTVLAYGGL